MHTAQLQNEFNRRRLELAISCSRSWVMQFGAVDGAMANSLIGLNRWYSLVDW